jgi:pseudaminic acid synthase
MTDGAAKCMIVAELSANHNGDLERAKDSILAMAEAGADAVKLQTYRPGSLTLDLDGPHFGPRTSGLWAGMRPYEIYAQGSLPYEWHEELFELARSRGLTCFSTPFDDAGVDFLETLGNPIYKVASFEIAHVPLLERIAATGKPVIVSTGIATLADIELALEVLGPGRQDVTLLKCTSAYPAPIEDADLLNIPSLRDIFGVPVGLSDHTPGHVVPVVAVALGATVIEKHFTLSRADGGLDAAFSMEPNEFAAMVQQVRLAEAALGSRTYRLSERAKDSATRGRSVFVSQPVRAGEVLTSENLAVVRPGAGLHPKHWAEVLGRKARTDLEAGKPLTWDDLS